MRGNNSPFTIEVILSLIIKQEKKLSLMSCIKVLVDIQIPANKWRVYHLIYTGKSVTYAQDLAELSEKFQPS